MVNYLRSNFINFNVGFLTWDKTSLPNPEQQRLNFANNEMVDSYEEEISKTPEVQNQVSNSLKML